MARTLTPFWRLVLCAIVLGYSLAPAAHRLLLHNVPPDAAHCKAEQEHCHSHEGSHNGSDHHSDSSHDHEEDSCPLCAVASFKYAAASSFKPFVIERVGIVSLVPADRVLESVAPRCIAIRGPPQTSTLS